MVDALDRDIVWMKESLGRIERTQEDLRKDVSAIRELTLRHDEQLKAAQTRQTWLGAVVAAVVASLFKNWFHL